MQSDNEYTKEDDKNLDKAIAPTQTPATSSLTKPIDLGKGSEEEIFEKSKKVVSKMVNMFEKWDAWRKPLEDRWNQIYRLYFNDDNEVKTTTRSRIFVPMVFKLVEAALPLIVNTIFSSDSIFEVMPVNPADQPIADVIQILLDFQLTEASFYIKFLDFTKQLILYGTSYFKVYWKVKRQWVWERTPIRQPVSFFGIPMGEKIVGWEETKSYKIVDRRPEVDVLDILDVFPDPDATNVADGAGVFVRTFMSQDDLREMGAGPHPIYANTDDDGIKSGAPDGQYSVSRQYRNTTRGVSANVGKTKGVEILEFWGKYDVDGDGIREEAYIVVANRKVLLKATGNPFHHQKRPLIKSNLFRVPLEWYGIGVVEPVISQQHELNTLRRQRLDNINQVLNAMWKVKDTADIDLNSLITSPSGIIITSEMDGLEALRPNDVTGSAFAEASILESEMEAVTVTQAAQGNPASGKLGRTSSGARMIIAQSLEKFGTATRLIEETAVKRVIRMFHELNLQFLDDDDILRDPGLYGNLFAAEVTPEMLRAEIHIKMLGIGEMIGKEGKINQIASFVGMFKDTMTPEEINLTKKKMWTLMAFDPKDMGTTEPGPAMNPGANNDVSSVLESSQAGGIDPLAQELNRNGAEAAPPQATQGG